jgi:Zn-dependent peptidase ImmA (M78 family)
MLSHRGDSLRPATRAYTYRQKAQRSFAAELLSPFKAIEEMLAGDFSIESQQDVADYFAVSELAVRTSLVNHGRLEREDLDLFQSVA